MLTLSEQKRISFVVALTRDNPLIDMHRARGLHIPTINNDGLRAVNSFNEQHYSLLHPPTIKQSNTTPSNSLTMRPNNVMNIPGRAKPSNLATTTTPPNSFPPQPLTPPPSVDRSVSCKQAARAQAVLEGIKSFRHNRDTTSSLWCKFELDQSEYTHLQHLIGKDKSIIAHKLR